MQRILVVASRAPFPERDGFTVRLARMTRALAGHYEQDLLVLAEDPPMEQVPFSRCEFVAAAPLNGPLARIRRRLNPPHFDDSHYLRDAVLQKIAALQDERQYAACIVHTPLHARCLQALPKSVKQIIDAHDIWHEKYRHFEQIGQGKLLSHFRERERELACYRKADHVLGISLWDHDYLQSHGVNAMYVPIDFTPDPCSAPTESTLHRVLYAGGAGPPNIDAIAYFVSQILPRMQEEIPTAQLQIMGAASEVRDRYAAHDSVVCLPFLDCVKSAYQNTDLVVVPLRIGTGLKIKVLESFAFGRPTLLSPVAAQGIPLEDYAQKQPSDDPAEFAADAVRALKSSTYRDDLVRTGLDIIKEHYNQETVYQPLFNALANGDGLAREVTT